jgi:hypothetical protein
LNKKKGGVSEGNEGTVLKRGVRTGDEGGDEDRYLREIMEESMRKGCQGEQEKGTGEQVGSHTIMREQVVGRGIRWE